MHSSSEGTAQTRESPNNLLSATTKMRGDVQGLKEIAEIVGRGSKEEEALDAEEGTELDLQTVSGEMIFVSGGRLRTDWSRNRETVLTFYVWKISQPSSGSVQTFEELPCSVLIIRGRLQSPCWTVSKAETSEFA